MGVTVMILLLAIAPHHRVLRSELLRVLLRPSIEVLHSENVDLHRLVALLRFCDCLVFALQVAIEQDL